MPFSTLLMSGATAGMTTLAFAIATPASAQQNYAHKHYAHAHYTHYAHYRHHAHEGRYIVVHAQEPVVVQSPAYTWGPVAAVGTLVGGTGQAVEGVFTGAGGVVGSFVGGVLGGTAALFGSPPTYAYGAPFAAPFNAAGTVAGAPFQVVGGAFGAPPPTVHASY
jgi:hypothetical protein